MKPSPGRIVHYYEPAGERPLPAMVVQVFENQTVDLVVFGLTPQFPAVFLPEVPRSDSGLHGRWCWPPRV